MPIRRLQAVKAQAKRETRELVLCPGPWALYGEDIDEIASLRSPKSSAAAVAAKMPSRIASIAVQFERLIGARLSRNLNILRLELETRVPL